MKNDPIVAISPEDNIKIAALLFDYVIPMGSSETVPAEINFKSHCNIQFPSTEIKDIETDIYSTLKRWREKPGISGDDIISGALRELDNMFIKEHHATLLSHGIRSVPIFHTLQPYENYLPPGDIEAVEFKLCRAEIIDTSQIEWEQITDLRNDNDFKRKLRNFRLFLVDNYSGKDEKFIVDDLVRKLDEYKEACRRQGLELVLATLSKTLDSKSLLGSLGIAAAGVLAGSPTAITAALVGGVVVEVGKMAVHIALNRLQFERNVKNAELSYLIEVEKRVK